MSLYDDFKRDNGGDIGDEDAMEGALLVILEDENFVPSNYMKGLARTGRGLTRMEADAINYRQNRGIATRQFLTGGSFKPKLTAKDGDTIPVRMPDETVDVPVGPQYGFDNGRGRFKR